MEKVLKKARIKATKEDLIKEKIIHRVIPGMMIFIAAENENNVIYCTHSKGHHGMLPKEYITYDMNELVPGDIVKVAEIGEHDHMHHSNFNLGKKNHEYKSVVDPKFRITQIEESEWPGWYSCDGEYVDPEENGKKVSYLQVKLKLIN